MAALATASVKADGASIEASGPGVITREGDGRAPETAPVKAHGAPSGGSGPRVKAGKGDDTVAATQPVKVDGAPLGVSRPGVKAGKGDSRAPETAPVRADGASIEASGPGVKTREGNGRAKETTPVKAEQSGRELVTVSRTTRFGACGRPGPLNRYSRTQRRRSPPSLHGEGTGGRCMGPRAAVFHRTVLLCTVTALVCFAMAVSGPGG